MYGLLGSLALLHGSAVAATPLYGEDVSDLFGNSVSDAGDVNGDGYDDLVVGAQGADGDLGQASLYLGSAAGTSDVPALVLYGDPARSGPYGTLFGSDVSSAGDVNGDGYGDVAIAADGPGVVYVHLGGPAGLSATPAVELGGTGFLGTVISEAGDVNGDGYDDLVVGSRGDGHYAITGRARVYLGSATGVDPVAVVTWSGGSDFYGDTLDYYFGGQVSGAGDVNGDGYDDVLVTHEGLAEIHLYEGSAAGPGPVPAVVWTNPTPTSSTEYRLSGAGDVNGDGYDDVIVGSLADGGTVVQFFGSAAGAATTPSRTLRFPAPSSISDAGDVNGDGYDDVVLGSAAHDLARGRVEILAGSAHGLRRDAWGGIGGGVDLEQVGRSVSSAGDVNGDGFADVIVGGNGSDGDTGRALVTTGHADPMVSPTLVSVSGGVTIDVSDAPPGERVRVFGADDAARPARCREDLGDLCLGLNSAVPLGSAVTDASGALRIEAALPPGIAEGTTLRFVAVAVRDSDGWRSSERSEVAVAVVAP